MSGDDSEQEPDIIATQAELIVKLQAEVADLRRALEEAEAKIRDLESDDGVDHDEVE